MSENKVPSNVDSHCSKHNYRIDHLAFRTFDRKKAVSFLCDALGYREATQFQIDFDKEKNDIAICSVLEPSDRVDTKLLLPWIYTATFVKIDQNYVLSPEIFVSEGTEGSIVYNWSKSHSGAGLHHIALQVSEESTVEQEMRRWLDNGWCESFTSSEPFKCDEMSQIFTKPSSVLGVIFELIKRKESGFCRDSVLSLMESTRDLSM